MPIEIVNLSLRKALLTLIRGSDPMKIMDLSFENISKSCERAWQLGTRTRRFWATRKARIKGCSMTCPSSPHLIATSSSRPSQRLPRQTSFSKSRPVKTRPGSLLTKWIQSLTKNAIKSTSTSQMIKSSSINTRPRRPKHFLPSLMKQTRSSTTPVIDRKVSYSTRRKRLR